MPPRKKPTSRKPKRVMKPSTPIYVRYSTPRPRTPLPPPKKTLLERSQNITQKIKPYLAVAAILLTVYATGKQIYGVGKNVAWGWKRFRPVDVSTAEKILNGNPSRYQVIKALKGVDEIERIKGESPLTLNVGNRLHKQLRKIELMNKITEKTNMNALRNQIKKNNFIPATSEELKIAKEKSEKSRQRLLGIMQNIGLRHKSPNFSNLNPNNLR